MAKFEVYEDSRGEFRWRLKARNGEIIAIAEEGFSTKDSCMRSIETVRKNAASADVSEE